MVLQTKRYSFFAIDGRKHQTNANEFEFVVPIEVLSCSYTPPFTFTTLSVLKMNTLTSINTLDNLFFKFRSLKLAWEKLCSRHRCTSFNLFFRTAKTTSDWLSPLNSDS